MQQARHPEGWRDLEVSDLSDKDLLDLMRNDAHPVGKAWRVFRTARARLSILEARAKTPNPIEVRRAELEELLKLLRLAGVGIRIERD